MKRIPMTSGDEHDVLGRHNSGRQAIAGLGRAGVVAKTKRRYRRRERRVGKAEIAQYA